MRIVEEAAITHPGARELNEDALLCLPELPLYAVADGMGGEDAGEVAAHLAIDQLITQGPELRKLNAEVANDRTSDNRLRLVRAYDKVFNDASAVIKEARKARGHVGMAATLLVITLVEHFAYVAHVGDSRAYLLREGKLLRLTEDHSVAEFRFRRGRLEREEYVRSPERQLLYQALGTGAEVDVDLAEVRLADGDIVLICSDGLIRAVSEEEIAAYLVHGSLKEGLHTVVEHALQAGAPDNLTATALRIGAEEGDEPIELVTDALAQCFLFAALSRTERLLVAPYVEELGLARGDQVTVIGQAAGHLGIVVSGRLVEVDARGNRRQLERGCFFGGDALARPGTWRATRHAEVASRVLWFSRERFRELVRYKPDVGGRMALALAEHLCGLHRDDESRLDRIAGLL